MTKTAIIIGLIIFFIVVWLKLFNPANAWVETFEKLILQHWSAEIQAEKAQALVEEKKQQLIQYCKQNGVKCDLWTEEPSVTEQQAEKKEVVKEHASTPEQSMRRNQDKNPLPPVHGNTPQKRFEAVVEYYGYDPLDFVAVRKKYWIPEELIVSIVRADTGFLNFKSHNNIGNVGNNDRWDTVAFSSIQAWLMAMWQTLTNKYLWDLTMIGELSQWGRTAMWLKWCAEKWEYCYATSPENWNKNVLDMMSFIHGKKINEDFTFRN